MVKTEADNEEYQRASHLGSRIEAMHPCIFVEIEEDVHNKFINAKLTLFCIDNFEFCNLNVSLSTLQLLYHLLNAQSLRT